MSCSIIGHLIIQGACRHGVAGKGANEVEGWDLGLHLPAWLSDTEKSQIEMRLDGWAQDLLQVTKVPNTTLAHCWLTYKILFNLETGLILCPVSFEHQQFKAYAQPIPAYFHAQNAYIAPAHDPLM